MITVSCPECKNGINLDSSPEIGQLTKCTSCQTVLEVTWLYPISLDYQEQPLAPEYPNPEVLKAPDQGSNGEV